MLKKLTQSFVQSLKPEVEPYCVTDTECGGLYVYVGKSKKTYYLKYLDHNKKQRKHKIGEAGDVLTVTQARILSNQLKARLATGELLVPEKKSPKLSLGEFINDIYAPWRRDNHKAAEHTLGMLRSNFESLFYSKEIANLSILEFYEWRKKRLQSGRKAATVNKNIVALKAALNWGVKHNYILSNPLAKMETLKEYDSDTKVRYLTEDERSRLMLAIEEREKRLRHERDNHNKWLRERGHPLMPDLHGGFADHIKPMVLLALNTGIRQGNLFALKWGDVDFNSKTLTLRAAVSKAGKTHQVSLNDVCMGLLTLWRQQWQDKKDDDLVFPSPVTGSRLTNVKKAWSAILKEADIKNFRWHDMRHDFASRLVMHGVDLNTVRDLLGHADLKMTLRYAHLAPNVTMRAVEILNDKLTW